MVDKWNEFQKEFLETLTDIQENSVQAALEQDNDGLLESKYYDVTSEVIIRIMEIIEGCHNQNIGKLKVTYEKSRRNPILYTVYSFQP